MNNEENTSISPDELEKRIEAESSGAIDPTLTGGSQLVTGITEPLVETMEIVAPIADAPSLGDVKFADPYEERFFTMDWVTRDRLSSVGKNTFRMRSDKYDMLHPGDHVRMRLRETPDGGIYLIEDLVVKAISRGSYGPLSHRHAKNNHGVDRRRTTPQRAVGVLNSLMRQAYGTVKPNDQVVVIHFH